MPSQLGTGNRRGPGAKGPGQRFGYFAAGGKVTRAGARNTPFGTFKSRSFGKSVLSTSARTGSAAADSGADPIHPCRTDCRFKDTRQKHSCAWPQSVSYSGGSTPFFSSKKRKMGAKSAPLLETAETDTPCRAGNDFGTQQPALPTAPRQTKTAPALQQAPVLVKFT